MVTVFYLTEDIINKILCVEYLSIKDIINFSSTCKYFHHMMENNNTVWRYKFNQRWPRLKKICEKEMRIKEYVNCKELIKRHIECGKELRDFLVDMSKKHYDNYAFQDLLEQSFGRLEMSRYNKNNVHIDEKELNLLIHPNEDLIDFLNYFFLIDEIKTLDEMPQSGHKELTNIYYSRKLLPFLIHHRLRYIWQKFINRPAKKQLLEEATTFVAQWYQPEKDITFSQINMKLDDITQEVMNHLKIKNPQHPIFLVSHEQLKYWKCNNISDNQWNDSDSKQILNSLYKVFLELNFQAITFSENTFFLQEYVLINYVLEQKIGYVLSLAIIYHSIARRLGIRCDLIAFPGHCFLSWKPKYKVTNSDDEENFYIDILHHGALLSKNDCPRIRGVTKCPIENFQAKSKINFTDLILRLTKCIQMTNKPDIVVQEEVQTRWVLELQHLVKPDNMDTITQLCYYYMKRNICISPLVTALQKIDCNAGFEKARYAKILIDRLQRNQHKIMTEMLQCNKEKALRRPKRRRVGMKFAIGMIVKIKDKGVEAGVIIAWEHLEFNFNLRDCNPYEWYYMVICENERLHYVTEDSIDYADIPKPVNHSEIGKYFCQYKNTYYMPNEMLSNEYPHDMIYLFNLFHNYKT